MGCEGKPIDDAQEQAMAQFYRMEANHLPGDDFLVSYESERKGGDRPRHARPARNLPKPTTWNCRAGVVQLSTTLPEVSCVKST